jgi:hypothetical protein
MVAPSVIPALQRLRQEDQGQPGLHSETLFQKKKKEKKQKNWK